MTTCEDGATLSSAEDVGPPNCSFGLRHNKDLDVWEVFFRSSPEEVWVSSKRKSYASMACHLVNGCIQVNRR